jgi:hypothetical protein
MITMNVDRYDFREAFRAFGRADQFSPAALDALFEYLDELSDDTGEPYSLDVIALCCEWAEYSSAREAAADYGLDHDAGDDDDEIERVSLEWLRDRTTVLETSEGVVIQQF